MAKGKRLDNNRHGRKNNIGQTGRFRLIPDNSEEASNIAVGDKENQTINFDYTSQNTKVEPSSNDRCDETVPTMPGKSVKFNWYLFILAFVVLSLIGAVKYDHIVPLANAIGGLFFMVVDLLFSMAQRHGWKPGKIGNASGAIGVGALVAALFLACVCGYGGWRLNLVSKKEASQQGEIVSTQPSEEIDDSRENVGVDPTIEPSPSLPSIVVEGDVVEPIIVTPQPNNTDVVLQDVQADYFELIHFEAEGQDNISFTAGEIEKWKAEFVKTTRELIGTRKASDTSKADQARFENLTMEANKLEQKLMGQEDQIAALQDIIQLREDAYEIKRIQSLCNMLSNNYMSLAKEHEKKDDYTSAYQSYYTAAKWAVFNIQGIDQADDNYYQRLYSVATVYQGIGSLEGLSDEDRIDANYISLCLFEVVSQHLTSGGNMQYLSCIYAGMVSHKLLNLDTKAAPEDLVGYFEEAYAYYEKALETPNKDEKNIYGYLSQICAWAEQYSQTKKGKPLLQDAEVYKELAEKFKKMSR